MLWTIVIILHALLVLAIVLMLVRLNSPQRRSSDRDEDWD